MVRMKSLTLSEKVLSRTSGKKEVRPGDVVTAKVDLATAHDACGKVLKPFSDLGVRRVWDPEKIVIALDHWVPATSEDSARLHLETRKFVRRQSIKNFYDAGRGGVCHQVVAEEGFVKPGMLVVGTDSHTTTLGALGAFATGIGVTEMAVVFATGKLWLRVPESVKIILEGKFGRHVTGKDAILHVIGELGTGSAIYKALEFCGPAVERMGISGRMTMANMSVEMGAKAGMFVQGSGEGAKEPFRSDPGAVYQKEHEFDISGLEPQVACPPGIDNVVSVSKLAGRHIPVDQVFIGSCTNGRLEDIEAAAKILRGGKIHRDVRLLVAPASRRILCDALSRGMIKTLLDAHATIVNPGCSACFGGHTGILAPGETCLSTGNRNFTGRMGSAKSSVYVSSPAVAAASAIYGEITSPEDA
jgi:3-isopropylmalate dehydratase large subunit